MKKYPLVALAVLLSTNAFAVSTFSIGNLSAVSQSQVNTLIQTIAIGTTHRAYMPASAMGFWVGLDVGIEATFVRIPQSFKDAVSASAVQTTAVPSYFPVPKLNVHKGLPWGIDVGLSYIGYGGILSVIGGDIKYTFLNWAGFDLAARFSGTSETLWYVSAKDWQPDVLASINLGFIEPYFGAGLRFWSGSINIPTSLPASSGLPSTVSASASGTAGHFFAGAPLKMFFLWLTPEVDYSTTSLFSAGAKLSLNF